MTRAPGSEPRPSSGDVQRLVEALVFAPIGLGATIVHDGPAALKRVRQELNNARFMGQMAVTQGQAQIKRRLEEAGERPAPPKPIEVSSTMSAPSTSPDVASDADASVSADDLALPDYDTLPAIDIVAKLEHLSAGDRDAIRAYESTHRKRRTVLGKLDQLAAG